MEFTRMKKIIEDTEEQENQPNNLKITKSTKLYNTLDFYVQGININ